MKTLVTGRETMTSKARVQAFFRGEKTVHRYGWY